MMIEKKGVRQNLGSIEVLIEDTSADSLYFNMKVPDTIPGGKTAISIDPPPFLLKIASQVKVEVIDSAGNPVYVEFPNDPYVPAYEYGYSEPGSTARLLSISVYASTPYGYGEIIVVGEALKIVSNTEALGRIFANISSLQAAISRVSRQLRGIFSSNRTELQRTLDNLNRQLAQQIAAMNALQGGVIPDSWRGVYNVRWRKRILLDSNRPNDSKVIFYKTPSVNVTEIQKPYLNQSYSAGKVVTVSTAVNPLYKVNYRAGYDYAIVTAVGFTFTQDMVGGVLTVPSPTVPYAYASDRYASYGQYVTYIDSLINNTQAYVRDAYTATQKPGTGYLSTENIRKYLSVKSFDDSDFTLSYNAAPAYSQSPNLKAFAKFDITELDTFSGDLYRLKIFQSSDGTVGGFKMVGEKNFEDSEILFNHDAVDPTSQYMGMFSGKNIFDMYWASSSWDFGLNTETTGAVSPIVSFDSNTLMNGMIISSSKYTSIVGLTTGVQFIFPTTQSFFRKGDQLEVSFKLANLSGDGRLDVYASGSAFYQNTIRLQEGGDFRSGQSLMSDMTIGLPNGYANANKFGKLVTFFSPDTEGLNRTRKTVYGKFSIPIETNQSGSGSVLIAAQGGQWVMSDVSLVYKQETNFSPSAFTFSIPLEPEQEGDAVLFGLKYYNRFGEEVIIPVTPSPNAPPNLLLGKWTDNRNLGGGGVGASKIVLGPNTYIDGTRNVMSGSLWIGSQVGHYRYGEIVASGGMELSADAAPGPSGSVGKGVLFRSLGYQGWYRANKGFGSPGFMIWSGSILPQSGDNYGGVGIELWSSGSGLRFRTDLGILEITGSIIATSGRIGGWEILSNELRSYPNANMSLSGSGAGYIVARDEDLVDRVFFGITPVGQRAADGWRDPLSVRDVNLIPSGGFETATPGVGNPVPGWTINDPGSNTYVDDGVGKAHDGTKYLYFRGDGGANPSRYAQTLYISSSIGGSDGIASGSTYNLSFWYKDDSSGGAASHAAVVIYQASASTLDTYIIDGLGFDLSSTWRQVNRSFTTAATSNGTGSISVRVYVTTDDTLVGQPTGSVSFDSFELRGYGYFTDISQKGLFVYSSPSSYIKLGADATGLLAVNQVTASIVQVYNSINVDGAVSASRFLLTDGKQAANKVLTSDAFGNASWETSSAAAGVTQIIAGANITISPTSGTGSVTINSTGGGGSGTGISWQIVTSNTTMTSNTGYITSGSQIVLTLPTGSATGSMFEVAGWSGAWKIINNPVQPAQQMFFGNATASLLTTGFLSSSNERDSIRMVCVSESVQYYVVSSVGNIYIQ